MRPAGAGAGYLGEDVVSVCLVTHILQHPASLLANVGKLRDKLGEGRPLIGIQQPALRASAYSVRAGGGLGGG